MLIRIRRANLGWRPEHKHPGFDGRINLMWDGVQWGGENHNWYYIYWFCTLAKSTEKRWGFEGTWYDGPHWSLRFGLFQVIWSLPNSSCEGLV